VADLDALDRLDPHHRTCEPRVETRVARRIRAEPGRDAVGTDLDDAADRVALCASLVDPSLQVLLVVYGADDVDLDLAQERLRHRSSRDDHGSMARARALERVADIVEPVLERTREVRVPRPRQRHALRPLAHGVALRRPRAHPPRPVLVVAVPDDERERRAERAPVPEACEHLDLVGLDLLPRAAAVALLPSAEVGVDRVLFEDEPGRETGHDRDERRPVRLAGGDERQRHAAERTAFRITSSGASTPVQRSKEAAPCRTSTSSPSITVAPPARAASAVALSGYGRSTSVWPSRSSNSTSSRTGVACTTRSAARTSGGQSPRREKTCAPGRAAANARAAPPPPTITGRSNERPSSTAASVLVPITRPSSKTSVFTDSASASSQRAAAASLCGAVTFAPAKPAAASPRSASCRRSGRTSSAT